MKPEFFPSRGKQTEAPSEGGNLQAEEEDDLDKLLEQYERQAEADKAKVLSTKEEKALAQMGMAELRESALAKPLSAQTKSVLCTKPDLILPSHFETHFALLISLLRVLCLCRGFQLLAKMGYKEGEGIGTSVKGRVAPIAVDLKSGRTGLGIDEGRKRQREAAKLVKEAQGAKVCACVPVYIFALWMRGTHEDNLGVLKSLQPCFGAQMPSGGEAWRTCVQTTSPSKLHHLLIDKPSSI